MNENNKKTKKLVTVVLIVIAIMVTGVIVLAHNNDIFKPSKPSGSDGRWRVEFTSIAEGEKIGNASSRHMPYHTSTYASFYVDFVVPGDAITYDLQISNLGTLDSVLDDIDIITNPYNDAIKYEIEGINVGDKIKHGESKNFKIKISYELHATEVVEFDEPISIMFTFKQDR